MKDSDDLKTPVLTYVGIASSAGGLEAVSALVKNLPANAHAVYILAQHMSPTHTSLLTSLISRETALPVQELKGTGIEVQPDTIYITPPNSDVVVTPDGRISLLDPSGHAASPKPSADRLFKSLAENVGASCMGIVLSGTGSDGSYGVQAIREAGGITVSQDAASAKYDGMPTSAIETGCIDLTLTPEQIGTQITRILANPRDLESLRKKDAPTSHLAELLQILLARTRVDFREYKESTVFRRIQRRMVALDINNYDDYVRHCRTSVEEVDALHRDLLVSVTRFFRDASQFDQLSRELRRFLPERAGRQIRVWVAGCATGEEAYSVAILLAEALGGLQALETHRIQVFATDIDERALDIARKGVYPITAAHDVPPDILPKYFITHAGQLEVAPEVRAVTLFTRQNIFQDPPFINLDLVTLRNVLIYFKVPLQEKVLARVHYALSRGGLLFLGTSETTGTMETNFEQRSGTDKIYTKRASAGSAPYSLSTALGAVQPPGAVSRPATHGTPSVASRIEVDAQMFDALARSVAPNGFVVSRNHDIIRVFGDVTPMLELNEQTSLRLSLRILRRGLRDEAPSLVSVAFKSKGARHGRWHFVKGPGFNQVRMVCYPIMATQGEDHMLVALETRMEAIAQQPVETLSEKERTQYILQIETEMQSTREALQQTVEELQTSNEELQSVNEELQSTNEELQATNEELETSNEELQSTNEELITVNEEMQVNASAMQLMTSETTALLDAAPNPVLVVDHGLVIRRCSKAAREMFQLPDPLLDNTHLSSIQLPEVFPNIVTLAADVFKSGVTESIQIEDKDNIYTTVFSPYFDSRKNLLGLTISVFNYDAQAISRTTEAIEQIGGIGSWRYNAHSGHVALSGEVRRRLGLKAQGPAMTLAQLERFVHPKDLDMVRRKLKRAYEQGRPFRFETRAVRDKDHYLHVQIAGNPLVSSAGEVIGMAGAFRDITASIQSTMIMENLERMQSSLQLGLYSYDVDNDRIYLTSEAFRILDIADADRTISSAQLLSSFSKDDRRKVTDMLTDLIADSGSNETLVTPGGGFAKGKVFRLSATTRQRIDGGVSHVYGALTPAMD